MRPVYASNNKSLSSEIKMPARTKAETRRSWGEIPSSAFLSCYCYHSGLEAGVLGPLSLVLSLPFLDCELATSFQAIGFLVIFRDNFFLGNPTVVLTAFNTVLVFI